MTNPAIEAVRNILRRYDDPMLEFEERDRIIALVAAVLDNLPRAEMAREIKGCQWPNCFCRAADPCLIKQQLIDAAIAAARATLLPGDAT